MESPDDSSTMPSHNTGPEDPASNYVASISQCMKCCWKARKIIQCFVNILSQKNDS